MLGGIEIMALAPDVASSTDPHPVEDEGSGDEVQVTLGEGAAACSPAYLKGRR